MSKIYFFDLVIHAPFYDAASTILTYGKDEGFIYFLNETPTSVEQVAHTLTNPTQEDVNDGGPRVTVVYCDTMFVMWIKPEKNITSVSIDCSIGYWKNEFQGKHDSKTYVDFARYIRLILKLCVPFPILSIDCGDL